MRNVFETKQNDNDQYVQYRVTKNNESRTGVFDPRYAVFRADILQVCAIINVDTLETSEDICTDDNDNYYDEELVYERGKYIKSDFFDSEISNVRSGGIYYYKNIERAFLQRRRVVIGFTGRLMRWYDDGRKRAEETFIDGKREGAWSEWSPNGIRCIEEVYLHGEENGTWSCWYENKKIAWTKEYTDNGKRYKFISWYEDSGEKESEGMCIINERNCLDHKQDGLWTYWDTDRNKTTEYYVNGKKQNIK